MGSDRARHTASYSGLCKCSKTCTPNTHVPTSHTTLNMHTQHTCAHKPHTAQHAYPTPVCPQATHPHFPLWTASEEQHLRLVSGLHIHKHTNMHLHTHMGRCTWYRQDQIIVITKTCLIEKKSSPANVFLLGSDRCHCNTVTCR